MTPFKVNAVGQRKESDTCHWVIFVNWSWKACRWKIALWHMLPYQNYMQINIKVKKKSHQHKKFWPNIVILPCFLVILQLHFTAKFWVFKHESHYEILAIQNNPFAHRQVNIQTICLENFRQIFQLFQVEKIAKVASYSDSVNLHRDTSRL